MFINPVYNDALINFIGRHLKRDRHKYKEWGWKKNLDIRPGPEYHPDPDERNKLVSFSKKATLKATILDIRMCSTELLL